MPNFKAKWQHWSGSPFVEIIAIRPQVIPRTNDDIWSIWPLRINFIEIKSQNIIIFIGENAFETVFCIMASIVFWLHCVKSSLCNSFEDRAMCSSSNELQRPDYMTQYQECSPNNGHQDEVSYCKKAFQLTWVYWSSPDRAVLLWTPALCPWWRWGRYEALLHPGSTTGNKNVTKMYWKQSH